MTIPSWNPPEELSEREQKLLKRRTKKLFGFLRKHRHELFDEEFQKELASMYRGTREGKAPVAPALLAMVTLLQAYTGASDAEAVELSIDNARWQMVLGVLGAEKAPFSQGVLSPFRERLIAHEMDRRLLERTVELARRTGEFDPKKASQDATAGDRFPATHRGREGRRHIQPIRASSSATVDLRREVAGRRPEANRRADWHRVASRAQHQERTRHRRLDK